MEDKKRLIHDCAKKLFVERGFKRTNITAIAGCAGIAVGTFYLYYASKEAVFMEIFLEENVKLKERCLAAIDRDRHPAEVISHMLEMNANGFAENPILRVWYDKEVFAKVERAYRDAHGLEAVDFMYDFFHELVCHWQEQGVMRKDIDSKMIMAMFSAIINIDEHKEEIGIHHFPRLLELITDFVMNGLLES